MNHNSPEEMWPSHDQNSIRRQRRWHAIGWILVTLAILGYGLYLFQEGDHHQGYGALVGAMLAATNGLLYCFWYYGRDRDPQKMRDQIQSDRRRQIENGRRLARMMFTTLVLSPVWAATIIFQYVSLPLYGVCLLTILASGYVGLFADGDG